MYFTGFFCILFALIYRIYKEKTTKIMTIKSLLPIVVGVVLGTILYHVVAKNIPFLSNFEQDFEYAD